MPARAGIHSHKLQGYENIKSIPLYLHDRGQDLIAPQGESMAGVGEEW